MLQGERDPKDPGPEHLSLPLQSFRPQLCWRLSADFPAQKAASDACLGQGFTTVPAPGILRLHGDFQLLNHISGSLDPEASKPGNSHTPAGQ